MVDPSLLQEATSSSRQEQEPSSVSQRANHLKLPPHQVEVLLERHFEILQDANPIFSKSLFLQRYHSGQCSESLISTICVITAKLTSFVSDDEHNRPSWEACLDILLSSTMLQDDLMGDDVSLESLDSFRMAYLLAFYEFHQFPGNQSWLRVGRMTRMAYRIGLDRLDHIRTLYSDWVTVSDQDIQEWRTLWWCIYRLDTYSNLSCGTPYLVDDANVLTSMMQGHRASASDDSVPELYLPSSIEDMSKVLLAAPLAPDTMLSNIHTITIATLRQAGHVLRLRLKRSQDELVAQVAKAERQLATIRLALPTGWLNPRRNALTNESQVHHHARMITVLHLRMSQLLLSIADPRLKQNDQWMACWQRILEACQDIAAVADQWDSSYCLSVDPAICFVIFTALAFLDLHRKMDIAEPHRTTELEHHVTVLLLQLKHFANIWTVPKLLKLSFESFQQSIFGPIPSGYVAHILSRFEVPFHPKWLQFLSTARGDITS
ncbi:hypothetical protein SEUCBS139899_007661 [Sporothrix eucalyptigena]|uniref:Xylanolytic transcriptional activator regulatory domain-containing protein n=1 Tax=Sporothrix eucalyptigena TaxID=1812306 RepID=A0ABP0ATF1_9PEZI